MSDNEQEVKMEIKPKKIKVKKEMSPERKEQLKAQLKKGRETSLRNRQKKMLVKKIDAKEKNEATDRKLARKLLNIEEEQVDQVKEPVQEPVKEPVKAESNHEVEELRNELKRLRDSMYEDFKAKEKEKEVVQAKQVNEVLQPVKEVVQPVKEVIQPVKPVVKIYNAKQKGKKYNNRGFL